MPEAHEMPRYRSHKEVRALEIAKVDRVGVDFQISFVLDHAPITVQPTFFARGTAQPSDFYVVYADGYASWSPRKAFLDGYSLVEPAAASSGPETAPTGSADGSAGSVG